MPSQGIEEFIARWSSSGGVERSNYQLFLTKLCDLLGMPLPEPEEAARERIRELGEQLDAHRKRQQALHPGLTLTGMYNAPEKLRAFESCSSGRQSAHSSPKAGSERTDVRCYDLTPKEKQIYEQGLVSVLKQIHDDLDDAVFHAYDWDDLTVGRRSRGASTYRDVDEIILERLVALNHERAEEEKRGHIRWLRLEFQNPGGRAP